MRCIICAGIPRSGSTLQYQIVKDLLEIKFEYVDLGWISNHSFVGQLDSIEFKDYLVMKSHDFLPEIFNLFDKDSVYVVSSYRDPRDIIVSLMKKQNKSFERVFKGSSFNRIFNNHFKWIRHKHILTSKYENFVDNIESEIIRINSFLRLGIERTDIYKIADKLSVSKQLVKIQNFDENQMVNDIYDKESLMHHNHINRIKPGQWKENLTEMEIGIIQSYAKRWMRHFDYDLFPTRYSNKLNWRIIKLQNHIRNRSLLKRLFNTKFRMTAKSSGSIRYALTDRTSINLYPDDVLTQVILEGKYERKEQLFLKKYLKKGDTFIDVGANLGYHSLLAAECVQVEGKVIAFEPVTKTFLRLKKNIDDSNFKNIYAKKIALSDTQTSQYININKEGMGAWNTFGIPIEGTTWESELVKVNTLDHILGEIKKINLIKIDVEGWELRVLKGAKKILNEHTPDLIIEFNEHNAERSGNGCHDILFFLSNLGYEFYDIVDDETLRIEKHTIKEYYEYENILATNNYQNILNRIL